MLDLELSVESLGRTSFAVSPLGEVVTSVRLLSSPKTNVVARGWYRAMSKRLTHVDLQLLRAIIPPQPCHAAPTFLAAATADASTTIDDWLADLETVDPALMRWQVAAAWGGQAPPAAAAALKGRDVVHRLAMAVADYWQAALAPYWPRMRVLLREEISARAEAAARSGTFALFTDLHPTLSVDGPHLRIQKAYLDLVTHADQVTLVPSVFVWPRLGVFETAPRRFVLIYGARGVGTVFDTTSQRGIDGCQARPLASLLGSTRAALLQLLERPTTTTEAARELANSPGTISRHLFVLRNAGLVTSRRAGRRVLYQQTALGASLVGAGSVGTAA
jgi:DNA-binding transcriptional ArsR family regulator